jgi:hypothetical protein
MREKFVYRGLAGWLAELLFYVEHITVCKRGKNFT